MKQFAALLFIALLTIAVLLFISNPELLEDIWLWIIGFIGYIILLLEKGFKSVVSAVRGDPKNTSDRSNEPLPFASSPSHSVAQLETKITQLEQQLRSHPPPEEALSNSTITVLRYLDDGETTLGLLYLKKKFFAYTLEDTFDRRSDQAEKVAGQTRIPSGTYPIRFNKNLTNLTKNYQNRFTWFKFHLEIEGIEGFDNVYVHIGNTHRDTRGCILIADGVNAANPEKMISHSRLAFERFYRRIKALLEVGEEVTIRILDEDWIEQAKLQPI